jgi:dTDP-4-dehydrorhamnose reductase
VLGGAGQLGSELIRLLPDAGVNAPIHDRDVIDELFRYRKPDVVFNCAAYNAVDQAETDRELVQLANVTGPAVVAAACRRQGATLVHYSTNFVFDGTLDRPYVESDEPAPISVYGMSKVAGETEVLHSGAHVLVIRTAALFGGLHSFPRRILERARSSDRIKVVSDQRVNPTYARDLAEASVKLAEDGMTGIVHAVNEGCCGWDELARAVLEEFGATTEVESVRTEAYPAAARRPVNGCLASTRYRPLRPWREALHAYATEVLQAPGRGSNP